MRRTLHSYSTPVVVNIVQGSELKLLDEAWTGKRHLIQSAQTLFPISVDNSNTLAYVIDNPRL